MIESYGLLNDIFPFPSILDAGYPIFNPHLANVLFDAFTFQVPICNLLLIFLCTRFHLLPLNHPVPSLHWESLAWEVSHGWVAGPSHNPQPGEPGDLFSRFSSSSLYRSLCQPQGSGTGFGLPRVFYFPGTLHNWRAFPCPPPGEASSNQKITR